MQKDVRLRLLVWSGGLRIPPLPAPPDVICHAIGNWPEKPFAAASLEMAEQLAESDPYIIANDDALIYGQDFVQNGLGVMERNPDYGVISGAVVNGDQFQFDGPELTEIHAVGGLVFLRKGLVTEFPPLEDAYWDCERDRQIKAKGFRSGYTRLCPYLHMGANFSVANPAFFTGA